MKLRDLVFRLSHYWGGFALSEWDRNSGKETHIKSFRTLSAFEDYVAGKHWELGWYDVVNVLPMSAGHGVHIVIARA